MKKNLHFSIFSILLSIWADTMARDTPNRFTLFEDRLGTHRLMSRQDFILDTGLQANKGIKDFWEKIRKTEKQEGQERQLAHIQGILRDFNKTEQMVNGEIRLKIPLPRFRINRARFLPRLEIDTRLGVLSEVQQRQIHQRELLEYVGNEIPASIRNLLAGCRYQLEPGDNIIEVCSNGNIRRFPYIYPDDRFPQVFVYGKIEARFGPRFYYIYRKRFKGDFKIYWRGRSDLKIRVGDTALQNREEVVNVPNSIHYSNIALDYRFRYSWKRWHGFLAVEEVHLAKLAHKDGLGRSLYHDPPPLWRGHLWYRYRPHSLLLIRPYLGAHYRRNYTLSDGVYLGTEFLLQKRRWNILRLKSQFDSEHFTLSASLNAPWLSLSGWFKTPVKSQTEPIKISTLYGLNFIIAL